MQHFLEKLEDRTLLDATVSIGDGFAKSVSFTDADGTVATISVKSGSADFVFVGTTVDYITGANSVTGQDLSLESISLTNTTNKTAITITTTRTGTTPGITLGGVDGTGKSLGTLSAATTNLSGSGISIDGGFIVSLTLGDVNGPIDMSGTGATKGVSITAGDISDCSLDVGSSITGLTAASLDTVDVTAPAIGKVIVNGTADSSSLTATGDIVSLQAVAWRLGNISAATLGTLKITGQKAARCGSAVQGDFTGNLSLTGPLAGAAPTLNTAAVAGGWGADSTVTGKINSLTVGNLLATLDVTGSVKSFKTSDPMALTPPPSGATGGLKVSGSASVTAGKQKINFANGQLYTSTNQMYSLGDLWKLDGGYDQPFSGKCKSGGAAQTTDFEITTDGSGNLCVQDETDAQSFSMAWATSGGQTNMGDWTSDSDELGQQSMSFSDTLSVPEYLELGKTYTSTGTLSGDWSGDVYGYTVDMTIEGNATMTVQLVDHENVMVGGQSVLAAKVRFGLVMSGTLAVTVDGQDYTGTYKANQQMQLYSTPDAGLIRMAMQMSVGAHIKGAGGGSYSESLDATVQPV